MKYSKRVITRIKTNVPTSMEDLTSPESRAIMSKGIQAGIRRNERNLARVEELYQSNPRSHMVIK